MTTATSTTSTTGTTRTTETTATRPDTGSGSGPDAASTEAITSTGTGSRSDSASAHAPTDGAVRRRTAMIAVMIGCLQALIVANLIQVAAGFAGAEPSPPADVVPGIAATAILGLAALSMVRSGVRLGYQLGIAFCLASMVGMGPHKLFLEDGAVIAPMALVGFGLELLFITYAVRALRVRD